MSSDSPFIACCLACKPIQHKYRDLFPKFDVTVACTLSWCRQLPEGHSSSTSATAAGAVGAPAEARDRATVGMGAAAAAGAEPPAAAAATVNSSAVTALSPRCRPSQEWSKFQQKLTLIGLDFHPMMMITTCSKLQGRSSEDQ